MIQDIAVNEYSYRMPFGIYKGRQIVCVPDQYLHYICRTSSNVSTVKRASEELERRARLERRVS